jgi:hypothetical protein
MITDSQLAESCGIPDILSESLETPSATPDIVFTSEGVTVDMRVVAYLSLVVRTVEQVRMQDAIAAQVWLSFVSVVRFSCWTFLWGFAAYQAAKRRETSRRAGTDRAVDPECFGRKLAHWCPSPQSSPGSVHVQRRHVFDGQN